MGTGSKPSLATCNHLQKCLELEDARPFLKGLFHISMPQSKLQRK